MSSLNVIAFANSLDPDQAQQDVGPDLDPICLTVIRYSGKNIFKLLIFKKSADRQKKHTKLPN